METVMTVSEAEYLKEHFDRRFDETLQRVEHMRAETRTSIEGLTLQVRETNGQVRSLREWKAHMEGRMEGQSGSWKAMAAGIGLVGTVVGIVISIVQAQIGG